MSHLAKGVKGRRQRCDATGARLCPIVPQPCLCLCSAHLRAVNAACAKRKEPGVSHSTFKKGRCRHKKRWRIFSCMSQGGKLRSTPL